MVENNSIVQNYFWNQFLAPVCGAPPNIWNTNITKSRTFDYIGQKIVYQCNPGFEFPLELLEEINVTKPEPKEPFSMF